MNQRPGSIPFHLMQQTDMPALTPQATDTASPNLPVPYLLHTLLRTSFLQ